MNRRGALAGILGAASALCSSGSALALAAAPAARTTVRLGYVGYPCEAATFAAPGNPIFAHHALTAWLVPFTDDDALIAALGRGTVDAASMKLPTLLDPLASGRTIRIAAALHAGCLRVLERELTEVDTLENLKGKIVATDRLHGPAMNLLAAILHREGIDPAHDVTWQASTDDAIAAGLDAKSVSYVAAADPLGYRLTAAGKAEPFLNTVGGGFSCGGDIARGHHCFLALSGKLVMTRSTVAAALTRAYLDVTGAIGRGVGPAAVSESSTLAGSDIHETIAVLSSYDWNPTTQLVLEEIELTARDFRRAGLLAQSINTVDLANRSYVDVLHGGDAR